MNDQNQIVLIPEIETLGLKQIDFGCYGLWWISRSENPLGTDAVLKLSDYPVCELFGYLLASTLDMPIPRFKGVWFDQDVQLPIGGTIKSGSIAVLIEYLSDLCPISSEQLAVENRMLAAKYLLLLLFDRFEPIDIFRCKESVVFLDMERIGPAMCINASDKWLRDQCDGYVNDSGSQLSQVVGLAKSWGVTKEFKSLLGDLRQLPGESMSQSLKVYGHPCLEIMSKIFLSAITRRLVLCVKKMGL